MKLHRNRQTGTLIMWGRAEEAGMTTEDGPWVTVCDDHGSIVHHPSAKSAREWAACPTGWCDECRAAAGCKKS
jgi:hypothetical protein